MRLEAQAPKARRNQRWRAGLGRDLLLRLASFTDAGDAILRKGSVLTEETISPSPSVAEVVVKDAEGAGVASVDSSTGDLYLKGRLYENVCVVWAIPDDSLVIRDDGEAVVIINSEGFFDNFLEPDFPWYVPPGSVILDGHAVSIGF